MQQSEPSPMSKTATVPTLVIEMNDIGSWRLPLSQRVEGYHDCASRRSRMRYRLARGCSQSAGGGPGHKLGGRPMSDQQQMPLHRWEVVSQGDRGENATTYRMRVPGGWLYRYQPNISSPPSSMAFVPDSAQP